MHKSSDQPQDAASFLTGGEAVEASQFTAYPNGINLYKNVDIKNDFQKALEKAMLNPVKQGRNASVKL